MARHHDRPRTGAVGDRDRSLRGGADLRLRRRRVRPREPAPGRARRRRERRLRAADLVRPGARRPGRSDHEGAAAVRATRSSPRSSRSRARRRSRSSGPQSSTALADALERERIVGEIARKVRSELDLDDVLRVAVEETARATGAGRAFIRLGEAGEPMPVLAEWDAPGTAPVGGEAPNLPVLNLAARERRTAAVADIEDAPELRDPDPRHARQPEGPRHEGGARHADPRVRPRDRRVRPPSRRSSPVDACPSARCSSPSPARSGWRSTPRSCSRRTRSGWSSPPRCSRPRSTSPASCGSRPCSSASWSRSRGCCARTPPTATSTTRAATCSRAPPSTGSTPTS